ncbi:MAG: FHA domain-containing protein [Actinobacteria bacterium]|nr:FHA domain-containing protein [Actinomycetota bacterium]
MPEIVYVTLRYAFLFLLYVFVLLVARTIYRELSPGREAQGERRPARKVSGKRGPFLLLAEREGRRRRVDWDASREMLIGRAPECSLCLQDEFASNLHAKLYQVEGRFYIEDLGSTNGTYVNGRRINYPTELRGGDSIKVGNTLMEFRR